MKITKLVHSCLLVEVPAPVNRTTIFDPGVMSRKFIDVGSLKWLDDIIITHEHSDHMDVDKIKELLQKFPSARITGSLGVVDRLAAEGINAASDPPEGITLFEAPHEAVEPLSKKPEAIGVHYLDTLSHPGDSLHFNETKQILALPVTAPWGATVDAVNLALRLKPKYIIPIHDWHWRDEARELMYDGMAKVFARAGIEFMKMKTGEPVVINFL